MFHACVQRFDGMDEKFLGGELNRAKSIFCIWKPAVAVNIILGFIWQGILFI
jgi:hypothetical protein